MKSKPCCNRGDVDEVARRDTDLASLFSNVFLADVVQGNDDQRLWSIRNIAIGIATPIGGEDVVVAPGQSKALGAKLNILERVLLKEIDARLRRIMIRVTSPQFAMVDINSAMRFEEQNQQMLLRYALVVEPDSGQVHTFVWLLKPGDPQHQLASSIRLLAPNYVQECSLHVDKSEYSWGLPSDNAFAVTDLPRAAQKFLPSAPLVPAMQRAAPSADDAAQLDRELRRFMEPENNRESP